MEGEGFVDTNLVYMVHYLRIWGWFCKVRIDDSLRDCRRLFELEMELYKRTYYGVVNLQ